MSESHQDTRGVLNCGGQFLVRCPMTWGQMQRTEDPRRRFCDQCAKPVFMCQDVQEAALRSAQRECVAIPARMMDALEGAPALTIGQLDLRARFEHAYQRALSPTDEES